MNKNIDKKEFFTVKELADILNVSRIAVFKKIQKGEIKAEKVGRAYIIFKKNLKGIIADELTDKLKKEIERGVSMVVKEYGETLKMLAKE
jgi:excisionase family DNA binding protein